MARQARAQASRAAASLTAPRRAPHSDEEGSWATPRPPPPRRPQWSARCFLLCPQSALQTRHQQPDGLPIGAFSPRLTSTPQRLTLDIGAFVWRASARRSRLGYVPNGALRRRRGVRGTERTAFQFCFVEPPKRRLDPARL